MSKPNEQRKSRRSQKSFQWALTLKYLLMNLMTTYKFPDIVVPSSNNFFHPWNARSRVNGSNEWLPCY